MTILWYHFPVQNYLAHGPAGVSALYNILESAPGIELRGWVDMPEFGPGECRCHLGWLLVDKKAALILNVPGRVGHSKWAIISAAFSDHRKVW